MEVIVKNRDDWHPTFLSYAVNRQCSWKKTQVEKKMKLRNVNSIRENVFVNFI